MPAAPGFVALDAYTSRSRFQEYSVVPSFYCEILCEIV